MGDHLLELINDILEVSKIEAGHVTLDPRPFNLYSLLLELHQLFHSRATSKNLTFRLDQSDDLPEIIIGDENRIRQILINMLGNAIKFTSHGGIILRAGSEPKSDDRFLITLDVEDTGSGIAPEELQYVFDPFEQTAVGRHKGGTGLGMSISRRYARMMHGNLFVKSTSAEGTVFRFECLTRPSTEKEFIPSQSDTGFKQLVPGQRAWRILVVDDLQTNRMLLVEILSAAGFETREADSGLTALEALTEWKPNLILMDMMMPEMDGREATRRIKALPPHKIVPVVMVTASAMEEQRREALQSGADDFIRKPFKEREVFDVIGRLLDVKYQ